MWLPARILISELAGVQQRGMGGLGGWGEASMRGGRAPRLRRGQRGQHPYLHGQPIWHHIAKLWPTHPVLYRQANTFTPKIESGQIASELEPRGLHLSVYIGILFNVSSSTYYTSVGKLLCYIFVLLHNSAMTLSNIICLNSKICCK